MIERFYTSDPAPTRNHGCTTKGEGVLQILSDGDDPITTGGKNQNEKKNPQATNKTQTVKSLGLLWNEGCDYKGLQAGYLNYR